MTAVLAFDVPVLLLAVGIGALVATTAVTGLSVPSWRRARRRSRGSGGGSPAPWRPVGAPRRPQAPIPATYRRRVVTGLPATLPPVPVHARQPAPSADDQARLAEVRAAEQLIDELLGSNPEEVARLMTLWIRQDEDR